MSDTVGFIKLHRRLLKWAGYKDKELFHVFITLLLIAEREPTIIDGINLLPGQVFTTRKQLATITGSSEQHIRTMLKKLNLTGEIDVNSSEKGLVITIVNWGNYQFVPECKSPDLENLETLEPEEKPIVLKKKSTDTKKRHQPTYQPTYQPTSDGGQGLEQMGFPDLPQKKSTDISTDISTDLPYIPYRRKEKKYIHGVFANVLLTEDEYVKLQHRFPNDFEDRIESLSAYIASKGVKYKSHYATILNWARMRGEDKKPKSLDDIPFLE